MTIEVPTPSAEMLAQLENITIETAQAEAAAVAAIRERFAPYAKHNGHIRIAHYGCHGAGQRISIDEDLYHEADRRKVHGLLCSSNFRANQDGQNAGTLGGDRLYLTEHGTWLRIERTGYWSQWEGAPNHWGCGVSARGADEYTDEEQYGGSVREIGDAAVLAEYDVSDILHTLGESMAELCKKLPERFNRLKANAELAQRTVEALK